MTLGQEFGSYAVMVGEDADRLREAGQLLAEINLAERRSARVSTPTANMPARV